MFTEKFGLVSLRGPTADGFAGTVDSDAVNMKHASELSIIVAHKGGTTGKATLTVQASTSAALAGATAIPFAYRRKTTGASAVWGAIQAATAAGIDTVAGEDTLIEIFVKGDELPDGSPFVNLHTVEATDDPVVGCIIGILGGVRYGGISQPDYLA